MVCRTWLGMSHPAVVSHCSPCDNHTPFTDPTPPENAGSLRGMTHAEEAEGLRGPTLAWKAESLRGLGCGMSHMAVVSHYVPPDTRPG